MIGEVGGVVGWEFHYKIQQFQPGSLFSLHISIFSSGQKIILKVLYPQPLPLRPRPHDPVSEYQSTVNTLYSYCEFDLKLEIVVMQSLFVFVVCLYFHPCNCQLLC